MLFRIFLSFALLAATCVAAANPPTVTRVYRADLRPPNVVFNQGLLGRGSRMDVLAHTLGGACEEANLGQASTWVSTSRSREEAHGFAVGHLEGLEEEGRDTAMWLYEIRADPAYVVVEGVMAQATEAGEIGIDGYTPEHARVLRRLMHTTQMGTEREVIVHYVHTRNIVSATALYFVDGDLVEEPAVPNPQYTPMNTRADWHVADQDLRAFIPGASIRTDYDNDATSCAMSCDSSGSSSSRGGELALAQGKSDHCNAYRRKQITREKLQLILGD